MQKTNVKLGEWIETGFNLYKNNYTTLVLAALIALILSTVTIGILTGPMIAGLIIITLQLLRKTEPKPEAGAVFKGFSYFLPSFLFTIIWGIAIDLALWSVWPSPWTLAGAGVITAAGLYIFRREQAVGG